MRVWRWPAPVPSMVASAHQDTTCVPSPNMPRVSGTRTRIKTKVATLCGVICIAAMQVDSELHQIPLPLRWRLLPCAPSCSFCGRVLCPLCLFDVHVPRLSCTLCVDVAGRRAVAWRRRPLRCPPCQWPVRPRPGMSGVWWADVSCVCVPCDDGSLLLPLVHLPSA